MNSIPPFQLSLLFMVPISYLQALTIDPSFPLHNPLPSQTLTKSQYLQQQKMVINQNPKDLTVKIPSSLLRCPISLDVMKSPVSLCTGVTYDRSSIQRWLDSGHTTCPATMQPLPSIDLVPNLTLQRLIAHWSHPLLHEIDIQSSNKLSLLQKLSSLLDDSNCDRNSVANAGVKLIVAVLKQVDVDDSVQLEMLEEAVAVATKILDNKCVVDRDIRTCLADTFLACHLRPLVLVLKQVGEVNSRINAARIVDEICGRISTIDMKELEVTIVSEMIRLVVDMRAGVDTGLSCLVKVSGFTRQTRVRMVRFGIVPILMQILLEDDVGSGVAEKALKLMEAVSGCREGREAICENAEVGVPVVLKRMMKVGREGREAAVAVLWSVCHLFRDQRTIEAMVKVGNGGLTKILLLMQSDCSAVAREMAGDLLRVFRVNAKCCLGEYDTKTAHIMPF